MLTTSDLDPATHRLCLRLSGEIDIANVPEAFAEVLDARPWPGDVVTLDLSEVTFIDSSGVAMLLKEHLDGMGAHSRSQTPQPR